MKEVVIVSALRTPIGSFMGSLSGLSATQLGSIVIKELIEKTNIKKEIISEVIMGCVLTAGLGQAPARQSMICAGIPESVPALTINKVCGSGLKSIIIGYQAIQCGDADVVIAGGMESMSNAPYYIQKVRHGLRMGHNKLLDGMIIDGLWDVYNDFHMGNAAEMCSREMKISREEQDIYATDSYKKALYAIDNGLFNDEIIKIEVENKKGKTIISEDEEPGKVNFDKGLKLKPAFEKDGTITAFNASKINDGASAVLLMSAEKASALAIKPIARITGHSSIAQKPEWFTTAPAYAIQNLLSKIGLSIKDIDLFEINEAFAVVSLSVNRIAKIDNDKVNVNGGAIALGHPIGASGSRILTTLLHSMMQREAKRGVASLCIGGGEAIALSVELLK